MTAIYRVARRADALVQGLVDESSWVLMRFGVPRSAQRSFLALVVSALSAARAAELFGSGPGGWALPAVTALVFLVLSVVVLYFEGWVETLSSPVPAARDPWWAVMLAWLNLMSSIGAAVSQGTMRPFLVGVAILILIYLSGTPRRPPPRKPRVVEGSWGAELQEARP